MERLREETTYAALEEARALIGRRGETRNRGPFEIGGIVKVDGEELVEIEFPCLPWHRNGGNKRRNRCTRLSPRTVVRHIEKERWILYPEGE